MPGAWPGCWATSGMPCTAVQAGGLGDRREQGHRLRLAHLMQQQLRQRSVTPVLVVQRRHVRRGQQQLVQQREITSASQWSAGAARQPARCRGCAYSHPASARGGFASGNPHAAVRRNGPCAIVRFHFHHPAHAVEHLGAPVRMGVEQGARRVVGADGQHGRATASTESSGTLRMAMDGLNRRIIDQSARDSQSGAPYREVSSSHDAVSAMYFLLLFFGFRRDNDRAVRLRRWLRRRARAVFRAPGYAWRQRRGRRRHARGRCHVHLRDDLRCGLATLRHHKAGTVPWNQVRPLLGYIAVGAIPVRPQRWH